nr:RecName: Full=Unknown endosperm protein C [Hordeum vulgare]
GGCDGDRQDM